MTCSKSGMKAPFYHCGAFHRTGKPFRRPVHESLRRFMEMRKDAALYRKREGMQGNRWGAASVGQIKRMLPHGARWRSRQDMTFGDGWQSGQGQDRLQRAGLRGKPKAASRRIA